MCGVDFTVYDLIPAGAAWMRAVCVRHSNPPTVDASGGAVSVEAPESHQRLAASSQRVAGVGPPIRDHAVHAEIQRIVEPVRLHDPGVDREPLLVGR